LKILFTDIKKVLLWYNTLQSKNLLDFTEVESEVEENSVVDKENTEPENE